MSEIAESTVAPGHVYWRAQGTRLSTFEVGEIRPRSVFNELSTVYMEDIDRTYPGVAIRSIQADHYSDVFNCLGIETSERKHRHINSIHELIKERDGEENDSPDSVDRDIEISSETVEQLQQWEWSEEHNRLVAVALN